MINIILLTAGLFVLVGGAEALVKGASRISLSLGVSPLVVGLTVVSFGTSAPELAVSLEAAFSGNADLSIGNVVGSNIFNTLLILGISSLIIPLSVAQQVVKKETPLMIGVSLLLVLLSLDGQIGIIDGAIMTSGIIFYTVWSIVKSRAEKKEIKEEYQEFIEARIPKIKKMTVNIVMIIVGLIFLVLGSRWVVEGASGIARGLGVSDLIIGLTIIAGGTSLPELTTSIMAALRKENDIAVGNIVGSNIFNILGILGISATVSGGIALDLNIMSFDIALMIGAAILCYPFFISNARVGRWEGLSFIILYILYIIYLVLYSTQSTHVQSIKVLTLTVYCLTLGYSFYVIMKDLKKARLAS